MQALTDTQLHAQLRKTLQSAILGFNSENPSFISFYLLGRNRGGKHTKAVKLLINEGYKAKLSLCKDFIIIHK